MNIYLLGDFLMLIKIISIIFTILFGTLFHFTYQLTNQNKIIGLFTATNESTFEHIKMALSARIFFIPIEIHFMKSYPNYYLSVLIELILISLFIVLFYYGYRYFISKKENTIYNISIFYVSIILSYIIGYKSILYRPIFFFTIHSSFFIIIILLLEIILTIKPLRNFLFIDPITKKYPNFCK